MRAFGGTLYVDSLSEADGPVPTYLDLLRHDAETIIAGLTGGATMTGDRDVDRARHRRPATSPSGYGDVLALDDVDLARRSAARVTG